MAVIQDLVQLEPGQYASIFISERPLAPDGYADTMEQVMSEAEGMAGYLGFESLRDGHDGIFHQLLARPVIGRSVVSPRQPPQGQGPRRR